ncbi:uncharacterized protein [Panulirus ornatus]|uniref:uncharacterized protein isoform X6 n=1 Tax=Panulirus ornatus TaxID=150431 RepID=UPI003A83D997
MIRGPSYDDSYITRKMSHMAGPTFSAPARPPVTGYLQDLYGYDYIPRPTKTEKVVRERRSRSPSLPWLWSDPDKYGKGWYRVDFGPEHGTQLCYLPTSRDRYNFLQSHIQAHPAPRAPYQPTRARSLPPPKYHRPSVAASWVRRTRSPWYTYWYYPSLGPYSGRVWRPWTSSRSPNRLARSISPPIRLSTTGYHPLAPPTRLVHHRLPPSYYDYDYGYGGYYGYVPPPIRMSRYDSYLDDDLLEPTYIPRYHRPRLSDTLDDADYREKSVPHTTIPRSTTHHIRSYSPGARVLTSTSEGNERTARPSNSRVRSAGLHSLPGQDIVPAGESEGERHLTRLSQRYPTFSEPQMLQDHVDNMRIRLKSLAYSLDPTGPVPEIIVPDRPKKSSLPDDKKYSSGPRHLACAQFAGGQPLWRRKARARLSQEYDQNQPDLSTKAEFVDAEATPEKAKEKLIIKDRLSNRIHQFFNSTLNAEQFQKYLKTYREPGPKPPNAQLRAVMPESSRYNKYSSSKWEEPDTVFGAPSDKKPFSKVETGSSFFSTYGITNRKKDYVAEKVRDYYYFGDSAKAEGGPTDKEVVQAVTDGNTEEASEEKKERRKKKKSRERDIVGEMAAPVPAPAPAPSDLSLSEIEAVSVPTESEAVPVSTEAAVEEEVLDEKERKRLEKKKRKAEREAAAKAAMEAELAALAAAEAELARLEAESNALKPEAPVPEVVTPVEVVAAPADAAVPLAEPAAEVKSESAAEKCESSTEVVCEGVCVTPETLGDPAPSEPPLHVPPQEEQESPQVVEHVSRQLTDEPQAIHESVPALEPPLEESQVEPSMEVSHEELPAEESHVELPVEKLQLEAQLGTPVGVPKSEELLLEPPDQEPHAEESQVEPPVEEPQADEPQVEPPVEVPLVETSQVEAQMEAPYAKEPVAVVEEETPVVESTAEEPGMATRRAAAYDEDAGWLDGWVAAGTEETGLHLGTEVSEEPATRTIQAGPDHLTAADADDTSKLDDDHLVQQM